MVEVKGIEPLSESHQRWPLHA